MPDKEKEKDNKLSKDDEFNIISVDRVSEDESPEDTIRRIMQKKGSGVPDGKIKIMMIGGPGGMMPMHEQSGGMIRRLMHLSEECGDHLTRAIAGVIAEKVDIDVEDKALMEFLKSAHRAWKEHDEDLTVLANKIVRACDFDLDDDAREKLSMVMKMFLSTTETFYISEKYIKKIGDE